MNLKNNNKYNLVLVIFLILLLMITIILIINDFFLHQSISELQNFNNEIINKFEYLEKSQKEMLENFENTTIKDLEAIKNHQKTVIKNPIRERNEMVDLIVGVGLYTVMIYYIISTL